MKRILFRCDSSGYHGTGHVTRSFALAEIFAMNGWEVTFSGEYEDPKWIIGLLNKIKGVIIEKPIKIIQQKKDFDVIIFDSYSLDSEEVNAISKPGSIIVYLVDDISPYIKADIYVSTLPIQYLTKFNSGSKCLFGSKYALIRKEIILNNYTNSKTINRINQKNTLGLFSGGSAKAKFLEIILSQLVPELNEWNFKIFSEPIDLRNIIKNDVNLTFIPPKPDFYQELSDVQLIISSASVSSWEFISMEIPLAVYGIYQNQKSAYDFIVGGGYAEGIGFVENYNEFILNGVNLRKAVDKISSHEIILNQTQKIIDGNGPSRVYKEIIKFI